MKQISLIIPTLNEEQNIRPLVMRIDSVMRQHDLTYEIIFIDDNSVDATCEVIQELAVAFPLRWFTKQGQPGKAFSLLEGFDHSEYEYICMIDADLQYPPEAIPIMLAKIVSGPVDVVVANRIHTHGKEVRKLASYLFRYVFGSLIFGIDADVQSGLKVFRKDMLKRIQVRPSPWTFDLEFLIQSRDAGYKIGSYDIEFTRRNSGDSKISVITASIEIALSAFKLKLRGPQIIPHDQGNRKGFHFKGANFTLYTDYRPNESAFFRLTLNQILLLVLGVLLILLGLMSDMNQTLSWIFSIITCLYFIDLLFNLYLIYRSFSTKPEISISSKALDKASDREWPMYTIFCPLYKEWNVIPQFTEAIQKLDYPKNKVQVILLLEADDKETIREIRQMQLPEYFETVVVPHSLPKTKPKACNYGLLHTRGEYLVIYDAEDIPEPMQLKKAVLAFEQSQDTIICIQAKLNFYNPRQNILTRLFTAEYSVWFDMILPGLQSINAPIPLGGTSNHFRTEVLRSLRGWDPFNVTEDADLGMRIMKMGGKTAILDSTTYEEANSHLGNWFKQRSRWIKGYIQTYFVHTRKPSSLWAIKNKRDIIIFHLIIGGKICSMLINPVMWLLTISYFVFRSSVGVTIESLFSPVTYYTAAFSLIIGNFLYMYYYMIGIARREQWDVAVYTLLTPFYWLWMSAAAVFALWGFIYKPHYWHKTRHGLHIKKSAPIATDLFASPIATQILPNV